MRMEDCKVGMRVKTPFGWANLVRVIPSHQSAEVDFDGRCANDIFGLEYLTAPPTPEQIFEATIKAFVHGP